MVVELLFCDELLLYDWLELLDDELFELDLPFVVVLFVSAGLR